MTDLPSWVKEALESVPEEIESYTYGEDIKVEIPDDDTFPKLLIRWAKVAGDRTALREKERGIWQRITWREYLEKVKNVSLGLISLGFQEGDKITLIGDNRPEWVYTYLGAEAAKGIPFGVYQDNLPEHLSPLINNSDSTWIYCEDQEQTDKVLSIIEEIPEVEKIIVEDWTGMWRYRDNERLISLEEVMELGKALDKKEPGLFEDNVYSADRNDIATFATSSGTTGVPKCVILTYENMIYMGLAMQKVVEMGPEDDYFSFLPFAWIGEQMMAFSCALTAGFRVNFYEEPETVGVDMREVGPTIMFGPPRIWRDINAEVQVKIGDSYWIQKKFFEWAMKVGNKKVELEFSRQEIPLYLRLANRLAYIFVFRSILDKLGLKRIKIRLHGRCSGFDRRLQVPKGYGS
jgi:long-chain acyl-CoA synthetase